jgi:CDP-diacylglycerol--glycerol-3-phosphate 3-phosphatidyltransferase
MLKICQSNGFYGASGLKKHIPDVYATIESKFLRHVAANPNVKLYNYRRAGWSYHGKGVWITPLDEGDTTSITLHLPYSSQIGCSGSTDGLPILTTIGSSNYGYRSLYRDMEFQLIIYTQSKDIQRLMLQVCVVFSEHRC